MTLVNFQCRTNYSEFLTYKSRWLELRSLSSKQIREAISNDLPMCVFKVGLVLLPSEALNIFNSLKKVTSTRLKSLYLRFLHGDIYTNERLFRFGLREDPNCDKCHEIDTLEHRLESCMYSKDLITKTIELTSKIANLNPREIDFLQLSLGAYLNTNETILTIHSEILNLIVQKRIPLPNPELCLKYVLNSLRVKEKNEEIKNALSILLDE